MFTEVSLTIVMGIICLLCDTGVQSLMRIFCQYIGCKVIVIMVSSRQIVCIKACYLNSNKFPLLLLSSDDDIFLSNFEIFRMSCEQTEQTKSELDSCLLRKLNCVSQNRNVLTQLIWRKIRRIQDSKMKILLKVLIQTDIQNCVTWQEKSTI